jgi:1A family penicillin-binding protein
MSRRPTTVSSMVSEAGLRGLRVLRRRPFAGLRIAVPLIFVFVVGFLAWSLHDLPLASALKPVSEPIILLADSEGNELPQSGPMRGLPVSRNEIPQSLVDAVIAIEDRRFYRHRGVDLRGVLRAFARNMEAGGVKEGGSTITQQLARTLINEDDRTIRRKIREAVLALYMESKLSKDEILTRYLNNIYLGAGATGISAAAEIYFGKAVRDLTPAESAMIAGLIQAPSVLNPLRNLDAARRRAAVVLDAMVESGALSEAEASAAKNNPARAIPAQSPEPTGSWFADWAYEEAKKIAEADEGRNPVIHVETTLSPRLQNLAEEVVRSALDGQPGKGASQAALVAMRPDGAVVAMVGGRDYATSQFNRAVQARRQPGSTFKLFVYYAALRNGYSLDDRIEDAPLRIKKWRPQNFDRRYHGRVRLRDAFARSLNVATVRLAQDIGIREVIDAARALGIDAPLPSTPSLALGAAEVSLIDLTGAYASVLAGAAPIEPRGIETARRADGQPLTPAAAERQKVALGEHRDLLVALLQHAVEQGTGRNAQWGGFAAGKTGTTENHRDAWFVGFTDKLVVGVWVGNDDNTAMQEVTGGDLPAKIWRSFVAGASDMLQEESAIAQLSERERPAGENTQVFNRFAEILGGLRSNVERKLKTAEELINGALGRGKFGHALQARCNYDACARAYRSFRASDCSYQPYDGPRRSCTRGLASFESAAAAFDFDHEFDREEVSRSCNHEACARAYRSFRSSDCTYQPYRGRRKLCVVDHDPAEDWDHADENEIWEDEFEDDYYVSEEEDY